MGGMSVNIPVLLLQDIHIAKQSLQACPVVCPELTRLFDRLLLLLMYEPMEEIIQSRIVPVFAHDWHSRRGRLRRSAWRSRSKLEGLEGSERLICVLILLLFTTFRIGVDTVLCHPPLERAAVRFYRNADIPNERRDVIELLFPRAGGGLRSAFTRPCGQIYEGNPFDGLK